MSSGNTFNDSSDHLYEIQMFLKDVFLFCKTCAWMCQGMSSRKQLQYQQIRRFVGFCVHELK